MKRTILFLLALAFMGSNIIAQSVIYEDDFEAYNVGEYLAVQSPEWTTWSGAPGSAEDAFISDEQSLSPTKSVKVEGASTDLVLPMGDKIAGLYEVAFSLFVDNGYGAYYNFQHFELPGNEWAIEVFFGSSGDGEIWTDGVAYPFTFTNGTWVDLLHVIDIDNDEAEFYIDGTLVHTWVWSTKADGGQGANQLGGLNVYASALGSDDPLFYFDDISYTQIFTALYDDDFEAFNAGEYVAEEIPEWWTTWSNLPGSTEDALFTDEQASSGDLSFKVDGVTDLILKLGDKTAGFFEVTWMMYVPTGNTGYYNFQHIEAPGNEWAVDIFFNPGGAGELTENNITTSFSYSQDTWFEVKHMIDLDSDLAEFYLDGTLIHSWVWSTISSGGPGSNQLGSVDFYAYDGTGTPLYYVDDVFYTQVGGATDPILELDPDMFDDEIAQGTTMDTDLTVTNAGGADLEYEISVVYDVTDKKTLEVPMTNSIIRTHGPVEYEMVPMEKPGGNPPPTEDVTLNYDGPNDNSVGLLSPNEWEGAAKFPAAMVNQYAGMELYQVTVFINDPDPADDMAIKIYGMNQDFFPGELLHEQAFEPLLLDWNTIELTTPVPITGEDIWVACYTNQTTATTHAIGTDAGPAVYNGDWISSGPGWGHLAPGIDANWNIRAVLQGEAIEGWLSVDPDDGTVPAGDFDEVTVTYDASNLDFGTYNANLVFVTNAPESQFVELPVTLTVIDATGIGEESARIEMLVFPNPASSNVNVQSNATISRLTIYNHLGQSVKEVLVNNTEANVNVEGIDAGVYIIRMETENGYTTQKLVIE